jgi:hypothetical protein
MRPTTKPLAGKDEEVARILHDVKRLALVYYKRTGKPFGVTVGLTERAAKECLTGPELADARTVGYDAIRRHF